MLKRWSLSVLGYSTLQTSNGKHIFFIWNICSSINKVLGSLLFLFVFPFSFPGSPRLEICSSSPGSDLPVVISGGVCDGFSSHLYPCVTDVAEQHFVENAPMVAHKEYNAEEWWCVWAWSLLYQIGSNSKNKRGHWLVLSILTQLYQLEIRWRSEGSLVNSWDLKWIGLHNWLISILLVAWLCAIKVNIIS